MSKNNVIELEGREASIDPLSELLQTGAQKLILQAVEPKTNSKRAVIRVMKIRCPL